MESERPSPEHLTFTRDEWATRRDATPLTLTEDEIRDLTGRVELVSLEGVRDVYLPLSRLLNLRVAAACRLRSETAAFLDRPMVERPYLFLLYTSPSPRDPE